MLEFSEAPYRFFEAWPSAPLIRIGRALNRHVFLPRPNHRIREISVSGETGALQDAKRNGDRLLFIINHPSHSDPQALTEVQRRLGVDACFMAAYDVFLRGRLTAWSIQKIGNFSIDRYAETVERIAEDFYSRTMPRTGPRRAMARIGTPIDVREFSEMKLREALPSLTEKMQRRVQAGIDDLNERNDAPGAALVD